MDLEVTASAPAKPRAGTPTLPHLYFPAVEGFGETYRRVMLNNYFSRLRAGSSLPVVAELPIDDYGVPAAGSLVFAQHGSEVRLVGEDQALLEAGRRVFDFNQMGKRVKLVHARLSQLPVENDTFDLGWNFDQLLIQPSPEAFIREMARVCKAVFICVPNARNYGQYPHFIYHKLKGGKTCAYVQPRAWMARRPIIQVLEGLGMVVVDQGLIDVPWWPGFPELPDLVRSLLGRGLRVSPHRRPPEPPATAQEEAEWQARVQRAAFIERSRLPMAARELFAHNVYVLAVKPQYRHTLQLAPAA